MTRAHTSIPRKARTQRSRTRNTAPPPSSPQSASDRPNASLTNEAPRPGAPPISDALALCGILLSTLDPSVVLEFITKIAIYGVDVLLAISQSARAAERIHQEATAHAVRCAGTSQRPRSRTSRTTSSP